MAQIEYIVNCAFLSHPTNRQLPAEGFIEISAQHVFPVPTV